MQTIGIIGAMEEEVVSIKSQMDIISIKNIVGLDFVMGKMFGNNIILVRSGIGKVNAAICTQILIDMYAVDSVINIGVAGAVSKELNIGDIVISKDAIQHDFNAIYLGETRGNIPGMDSIFVADEQLVKYACEAAKEKNAIVGRVASADLFVSKPTTKSKIWSEFKALCADMEGAAIAQTASLNKIPFVIIRAISDNAEEGSSANFETFLKEAAESATEIVLGIVERIN